MKVYGELMEHEEVVFHSNVVDERDELVRRSAIRASAREVLERHMTRCSFSHDKGGPDSFASAVEDKDAPRRTQTSTSTWSRICLRLVRRCLGRSHLRTS